MPKGRYDFRFDEDLIERVDLQRGNQDRTAWITEAMEAKLAEGEVFARFQCPEEDCFEMAVEAGECPVHHRRMVPR